MDIQTVRRQIEEGRCFLGIEFGSTRIKAVLTDPHCAPVASGTHEWENRLENGLWTYTEEDIWRGLQNAYASLAAEVKKKYGAELTNLAGIGFSAMMHGYMVFDKEGRLLVPFRTWRNNNAAPAAEELTELFRYHIPARWSVAHLWQAIRTGEPHVGDIDYQTTLEGYVHWKLTGRKVIGIGEASGMFPVDSATRGYDEKMLAQFDRLTEGTAFRRRLKEILPEILCAGECAGTLTEEGAKLLDPSGRLQSGILLCPPEGDAGTGMVATNSTRPRTGNVSAGTSVFGMIVLEKPLEKVHPEIDIVTTPAGDPVGMVHCNNCTSDINEWVSLFGEFAALAGVEIPRWKLYDMLYFESEKGEKDCGGLLNYNYVSNEHITDVDAGRPMFVRTPESRMNLANFMRAQLFSCLGVLKYGCDILLKEEKVRLDSITGHGGLFKTERVGQSYLAAAINAPVTVMKTAGEGGAWGIAVLAAYTALRQAGGTYTLDEYLEKEVFAGEAGVTVYPSQEDVRGFEAFSERYVRGLAAVREAVKCIG